MSNCEHTRTVTRIRSDGAKVTRCGHCNHLINIQPVPPKSVEQMFFDACKKAEQESINDECTRHVNGHLHIKDGAPEIAYFYTSDWYDQDATLASFTEGRKHE